MASNEDKHNSATEQERDTNKVRKENPFIAFRRFADEKIGSALQSLIGLPSAVTKQFEGALPGLEKIRSENARHREEARRLEGPESQGEKLRAVPAEETVPHDLIEELKKHREQHRKKWERIRDAIHQGPENDHTLDMSDNDRERIIARAAELLPPQYNNTSREKDGSDNATTRQTAHNLVDLFFTGINMPNILGSMSPGKLDSFLPYVLFSPYSPLILEDNWMVDPQLEDSFPYCDAFEDLLLASQGRDMIPLEIRRLRRQLESRHSSGRPSDFLRAVDWVSRLQGLGLLDSTLAAEESIDEDDGTELAMYKNFLSSAFPKPTTQTREEHTETESSTEVVTSRVEETNDNKHLPNNPVLSTLTRSETTRFPDGRVETKLVLIKRFADGAETKTESVHTDHEKLNQGNDGDDKRDGKDEKKGWFWN